jgi:predicted Rossmann fold nucleotide-binding protein DprA/Smf involved in DNA uptake
MLKINVKLTEPHSPKRFITLLCITVYMTISILGNDISSSCSKSNDSKDYNYNTSRNRMNRMNNKSSNNNDNDNGLLLLHTVWSNWSKYRKSIYKQLNISNTEELIDYIKNAKITYDNFIDLLRKSLRDISNSNNIINDIITSKTASLLPTIITVFDEKYPKRLFNMKNITESIYPPLLLYVISKYNINNIMNNDNIIAVVGTRQCSDDGKKIAYDIGKALSNKYIIVTGLAKGIDYHVTLGTLDSKGKVIEVRPYLYPIDYVNEELLNRIITNGCIISENLKKVNGYNWVAKQLYLRNRIIAGIAKAVVIVEARKGKNSGTMHQVEFAIKRGKPVFIWKPTTTSNNNNDEFIDAYKYYVKNNAKGFNNVDELIAMLESLDHQRPYQQRIDIPY